MAHPSTGYMVARTLVAAPIVANPIVQYLGLIEAFQEVSYQLKFGKIYGPLREGDKESSSVLVWIFCLSLIYLPQEDFLMHLYWHGFLSSRLFLPELVLFGLSLFSHASNTSRLEIMEKGTLSLVNMANNLIQDRD
ncbi:hypothetical protein OIU76_010504 [Salix suchowensis]|uniref:UBIQUINONE BIOSYNTHESIS MONOOXYGENASE COQ6 MITOCHONDRIAL n=1 Tax=Salix koriyanagi TaxID=2511006 RepID=A0A9Q0VFW9_9ROSI|nr:hypothetical protein OIU76_010504 [Salix suchowensis]KAJ6747576.1 UBIQUINONE BIOSYNTHESIS MONOOXYGENASE COQ6 MITOCHONDRIAL [Salix koriyanagi]